MEDTAPAWVFGYGSLIWRPGFDYLQSHRASLNGYVRRFWQGSHDHRGVPEAPGRVVTLVAEPDAHCIGRAYLVDPKVVRNVFEQLDYREKNGYERVTAPLALDNGQSVDGLVYIAQTNNFAYLGDASLSAIASQIFHSAGPSGNNRDYLIDLAQALRDLEANDPHVFELEAAVHRLMQQPCVAATKGEIN